MWCRFPHVENPALPGPYPRPALVRQAFADDEGRPWVEVVFGTSKGIYRTGLQYFTIAKVSELDACGLFRPTRFCLDRSVGLPYTEEFFEVRPDCHTPVIGRLTEYGIRLLQMQISYLQRESEKP